tara:strand:- start:456 stop:986 length:531 start_codon:yes stop_codon:yes gene_type:complete
MSISQTLQEATTWFAWSGIALTALTLVFFIFNWNAKFRLVGASIFTLLLSASCWAFTKSYRPPFNVEGALYAPVVYDNGSDLVVAQAPEGFPEDAIEPTLLQIAGNLKGGGGNRSLVHVRLRKLIPINNETSKPLILGEVIKDVKKNEISPYINNSNTSISEKIEQTSQDIQTQEN